MPHEIISSLPFSEYAAHPGLNHSSLKLMDESPRHFYVATEKQDDEEYDTDDKAFGRAYHSYILEPASFKRDYLVSPKITRRGPAWDSLVLSAQNGNQEILWEEDLVTIKMMKAELAAHAIFPGVLAGTVRESSIFWTEGDQQLKARVDFYNREEKFAGDLKTTKSSHPRFFLKDIFAYSYHSQAAWYIDALAAGGIHLDSFIIVAQSKTKPYPIMHYSLPPEVIELGRIENRERLRKFTICKQNGIWPSYDEIITPVRIPDWKLKQLEN